MDRASIYFLDENDKNTYEFDEMLPPLPLPELKDTMERYYDSVKPFGSVEELLNTRKLIDEFERGIGAELQAKLKNRASKLKNWLDEWWNKYAYHMLRFPLNPYIVMALPLNLEVLNIHETPELLLKNLARLTYHTIEFWDLLHKAKIKPLSSNGGKIKYSSTLYKHFFSTCRVPGVEYDHIEKHFRAESEGKTPSHALISGKGRLFIFDCLHDDGSIITPQELIILLQRVRSILDYEPMGDCVPILTHDERTSWAHNRQHLQEISSSNQETIKLIESSNIVIVFDENEPKDYAEVSQMAISGDYHSKWGDRSSTFIAYKNGKFACVGEHSAYDGTVSVSYVLFIQLSVLEEPEPDWRRTEKATVIELTELKFDLDNRVKEEIQRLHVDCDNRNILVNVVALAVAIKKKELQPAVAQFRFQRTDVIATHTMFGDYGKDFIKTCKLHPDSFVQVIMQLAYTKMHKAIAPTYETALMRHYYNGRTETLRSCTTEVHRFIKIATNPNSSKKEIVDAFKTAVEHHNFMMNEARKGHGVDRHLFGLWCAAYENNLETPDFFSDPLYAKSGGGGNFVLSTSTLGYTINVGFVAPMVLDGYGVFYTITSNALYIQTTAFRDSTKTSAHKYNEVFKDTFRSIKSLIDDVQSSKL